MCKNVWVYVEIKANCCAFLIQIIILLFVNYVRVCNNFFLILSREYVIQ